MRNIKARVMSGAVMAMLALATNILANDWALLPGPKGKGQEVSLRSMLIAPDLTFLLGTKDEGLYLSKDQGATWKQVNEGLTGSMDVSKLFLTPDGTLLANLGNQGKDLHPRVFRLPQGAGRWEPCPEIKADLGVVFALGKNNEVFAGTGWKGNLYVSTDNGKTFKHSGKRIALPMYVLGVAPNGDLIAGTESDGMFRTSDLGENWINIGKPGEKCGNSQAFALNKKGELFIGAKGTDKNAGIYRYENSTWVPSAKGIPTDGKNPKMQLSGRDIIRASDGRMYCFTSDNAFVSEDDGYTWKAVGEGIPAGTATRGTHAKLQEGPDGYLYAGVVGHGIYRTKEPIVAKAAAAK